MQEHKCRSVGESTYYPSWIEEDGTEWAFEPVWEACEHGGHQIRADSGDECGNPVEYMGNRGRVHIQLCARHFEPIKALSRVRWNLWLG